MSQRHPTRWSRRRFLKAASGLVAAGAVGVGVPRAQALAINARSTWAVDRPPLGPLNPETVKFLIVHHSASRNGHTSAEAPSILRSFYDFHTGPEKGWNDIAYNFLIDSGGGVWEGRAGSLDRPVAGDATGGNQGFSQLVCLIGDYNAAQPSAASLTSLVSLLAWLADRYGVATEPGSTVTFKSRGSNRWPEGTRVETKTITGHRTMSQTTCPGNNLNSYVVGGLMADVTAARGGEVVTPTTQVTTTTAPTTTTTAPPTTTTTARPTTTAAVPSSSTSPPGPSTTTSTPAWSTTVPASTTSTSVSTTSTPVSLPSAPLAVGGSNDSDGGLPLLPISAVGLVGAVTGAVAWRRRRMS
jgi:hypothetical protein